MKITDGEKTMTLEELAKKFCNSFDDCSRCPAAEHCRKGHNGAADYLREVAGE